MVHIKKYRDNKRRNKSNSQLVAILSQLCVVLMDIQLLIDVCVMVIVELQ